MRSAPILLPTNMFPWQQFATSSHFMNRIALQSSQGEIFTWRQLAQKINHIAHQLKSQHVQAESAVALCGKNDLNLLLLYLASIQLGARVLGVNPAFPVKKIQRYCEQANMDFYYANAERDLALENIKPLNIDFVLKEGISPAMERDIFTADFQRPATMTLTSGSTGDPKAIVHNLQAHLANARGVCQLMNFTAQDSWLLSLPLYHVSGQGIVWRWLLQGACLHLAHDDFYQAASQVTHLSLVPTQLQRLLIYWQNNPQQLIQTQHILLGGCHIPVSLTEKLTALGIRCYAGYGMTEMASTIFAKICDGKRGVGQSLLGREYRLVEQEIWLRGAGLAMGYWQNHKVVSLLNEQGWLATKDKGEWIDGELVLLGRLDSMFISGGENIQPEEIENLLLQHPSVKQIFVLPKSDEEFGQRPVALVEFFLPFSSVLVAELQAWLANKIEKFKQPVAYYPLQPQQFLQGNIKLSRKTLQREFNHLLGINNETNFN